MCGRHSSGPPRRRTWMRSCSKRSGGCKMPAVMGVKVRFHKGAWWVFIHHRGRRRAKKIGDRETANTVARRIRERLTLGDLSLVASESAETFEKYANRWLETGEG